MKKFLFKFIDHDKKKITAVAVILHSGKNVEWEHDENDIEGYIRWLTQHKKWEHRIKQEIDRIVKDKYFPGTSGKEGELFKFADYIVSNQCKERESKAVNMNKNKDPNKIVFRHIMNIETTKLKYQRGQHPKNWVDIFNYDKTTYQHQYRLVGSSSNDNVQLNEACTFEIPQEELVSYQSKSKDKTQAKNNTSSNRTAESASKNTANVRNAGTSGTIKSANQGASNPAETSTPVLGQNQTLANILRAQANTTASTNFPPLEGQTGGRRNEFYKYY